jgi:hypothetical protein
MLLDYVTLFKRAAHTEIKSNISNFVKLINFNTLLQVGLVRQSNSCQHGER